MTPLTDAEVLHWSRIRALNIGVACGYRNLIALDCDADNPEITRAIGAVMVRVFERGGVRVGKAGRRGATSFHYDPTGSIKSRNFSHRDGHRNRSMILEVLSRGRQCVVPGSIHPETGRSYKWLSGRTLLDTSPEQLPVITPADVAAIEAALHPWTDLPRRPAAEADLRHRVRDVPDDAHRQRAYALAILAREAAALAAMAQASGRNIRAFHIACRLGRWVHHGIVAVGEVEAAILNACRANGLIAEDGRNSVLATIASGLNRSQGDDLPDLGLQPSGRAA